MQEYEISDSKKAKERAIRFLEQNYNVADAEAIFIDGIWKVSVHVGLPDMNIKIVSINAKNGQILDCA